MSKAQFSLGHLLERSRHRLALLKRHITERPAIRVGILIIVIALVAAMALHLCEQTPDKDVDPDKWPYATYLGTCQQVAILLFSGFDVDPKPRYLVSWLLMFICLFLGICLLALITADLASLLIAAAMNNRGRRRIRLKNHVVLCGWHHSSKAIVEQLTSRDNKPRKKIVVVDQEVEDLRLVHPDVDYVRGDPTEQESLALANTARADIAIIPLDYSFSEEILDSRITLTTMAVKGMNSDIYACVELLQPDNRQHIERTEADEVICVGEMSQMLLGQAAIAHGVSRLYEDLLTFNRGNEIHRVPLPAKLEGLSFRWLLREMNERLSCVLLSVERNKEVFTNPQGEFILEPGDQLFVLAERPPRRLERLAPKK